MLIVKPFRIRQFALFLVQVAEKGQQNSSRLSFDLERETGQVLYLKQKHTIIIYCYLLSSPFCLKCLACIILPLEMWLPKYQSDKKVGNGLVAVAIDRDKNSQNALKWALDNLLQRGQTVVLIHVKLKSSSHYSSANSISNYNPSKPTRIYIFFLSSKGIIFNIIFLTLRVFWRNWCNPMQRARSTNQRYVPSFSLFLYAEGRK